mgnify:CR=1 FL=1
MRLATFSHRTSGPRFGIVRGDRIVDVVAAAEALHRPVPAATVKAALTTGPQTLAALGDLAAGAPVNLEVDVLAKYVERLLPAR